MPLNLPQFRDHPNGCAGQEVCRMCRMDRSDAAAWREVQTGSKDIVCPLGKPMRDGRKIQTKVEKMSQPVKIRPRASLTAENIASLLQTMATRERVDEATKLHRKAACASCEYLGDKDGSPYCGAPGGCGCAVKPPTFAGMTVAGVDLCLYSEAQGALCRHPLRSKGKGWPG